MLQMHWNKRASVLKICGVGNKMQLIIFSTSFLMTNPNIVSQRVVAVGVASFGLLLMLRWAFQIDAIDVFVPQAGRLGLNTPMMLAASGVCLFLSTFQSLLSGRGRLVIQLLIAFVATLSTMIVVEHVFDINLGIDFAGVQTKPTAEIPNPGRVAPNTCVAFLLAAASLFFSIQTPLSRLQRCVMVLCVGGVMLVALSALTGHFLNLSALYRVARYNRMLAPTAFALFALSLGLWFRLQSLLDGDDLSADAFARRITRRSAGILALVAISTGVAGFAVLEADVDKTTSQNLLTTAVANGAALSAALEARLWFSQTMQSRPDVIRTFAVLAKEPRDQGARALLAEVGDSLLPVDVTAIQFLDAHGQVLSESGVGKLHVGGVRMPLNPGRQLATLVWQDGYFLQTENVMMVGEKLVGRVVMEQELPAFQALITAIEKSNPAAEVIICGRNVSEALCAPSRFYRQPRRIALFNKDGSINAPIVPKALNEPSINRIRDIRGISSLVAYTPLQKFGLGMTFKVDADSLSVSLREHIIQLGLLLTVLVGLGVVMARLQILPLLAQVIYEQRRNQAILASSNDAFISMDADGRVTDWNSRAEAMFQWQAEEAIGQFLANLIVPHERRAAHNAGFAGFKASGRGPVLNRQLEVLALRRDGTLFPVELSVTGFHDGRSYIANAFVRDISERKAVQQLLSDREKFLRTVTDTLPVLIGHVDRQERYHFANVGHETLLGEAAGTVVGKTIREVMGERSYVVLQPHIASALTGQAVHFEHETMLQDATRHFMVDYIPDVDSKGAVLGFYIMVLDISERKKAEILLRQSQKTLKAVTDNVPALITHCDLNERYLFVNAYVATVFGIPAEKLIGRTILDISGAAFYATIAAHIKTCLAGHIVSFEGTLPVRGTELLYQANYVPEYDAAGAVVGFYSMTFDITDRKRSEIVQKQSEERLRLIADNLPVLISYLDVDHRFRFGNATFKPWLGVDPADLIGRFMGDIVGDDAYRERRDFLDRAFAGETVHFDMTTTANGVRRELQTVYVPHVLEDGSVDGLYTISTDVTVLKDIERELSALARVDSLTGLPNRRQFDERMEEAIAQYRRTKRPLALMFLDIDKFKRINDTSGHAAGDEILCQFASRLKQSVRKTDIVARLAGDEFVVIIDGFKAMQELSLIAKKILAAIRKPMAVDDMTFAVTTSIGITLIDHRDDFASAIIQRADQALYIAKKAGRDRFHVSVNDELKELG